MGMRTVTSNPDELTCGACWQDYSRTAGHICPKGADVPPRPFRYDA